MKKILLLALLIVSRSAFALVGDGANLTVQNGAVVITGNTGGIPYFSSANHLGTSATLTQFGVLLGGGSGNPPTATSAGTANQVFRVPSGGAPAGFGQVDISSSSAIVNNLPLANGGTNANITASNGQVFYSTASAGALTSGGSTGNCLKFNSGSAPTWGSCSGATPIVGFGAQADLTTSQTIFVGPGLGVDLTEGIVQVVAANNTTFNNLHCVNNAIQGVGNNIVITMRSGACGSQADQTSTCTITGSASANQVCTPDTAHAISVTAGQCFDWKIVTPAALTANAHVNCTVERTA